MKEPEAMQEIHAIRRKLQKKWARMTPAQLEKEFQRAREIAAKLGCKIVDQKKLAA